MLHVIYDSSILYSYCLKTPHPHMTSYAVESIRALLKIALLYATCPFPNKQGTHIRHIKNPLAPATSPLRSPPCHCIYPMPISPHAQAFPISNTACSPPIPPPPSFAITPDYGEFLRLYRQAEAREPELACAETRPEALQWFRQAVAEARMNAGLCMPKCDSNVGKEGENVENGVLREAYRS